MKKITRRQFIKGAAIAGVGMALPLKFGVPSARAVNNSDQLAKWIQALRGLGPTGIPVMNGVPDPAFGPGTTLYQVTVGEFQDQLHPALGPTKLWGYWDTTTPEPAAFGWGYHHAKESGGQNPLHKHPARAAHHSCGHHAARRESGAEPHRDPHPRRIGTLDQRRRPVRLVDAHRCQRPELPQRPRQSLRQHSGNADAARPGRLLLPNNQSARMMWYHDHAHGITRLNAYAGIASGLSGARRDQRRLCGGGEDSGPPEHDTAGVPGQDIRQRHDSSHRSDLGDRWPGSDVQSIGSLWYEHIYNPKEFRLLKSTQESDAAESFGDSGVFRGYHAGQWHGLSDGDRRGEAVSLLRPQRVQRALPQHQPDGGRAGSRRSADRSQDRICGC